ncbi:DoxX family protein [Paenibacillus sp. Dod16]|uniref:DoxX family protein n=1 Tax=Paenibacillus sp. Dod16 TaxID=3416392 RepID=UPI003CF6AAA8
MEPLWIILFQSILIGIFALSTSFKFLRTRSMVQHWTEYRYPLWGMFVVAGLEAAGIVLMISAFWIPENKLYAASLFTVLMVGAIHAHLVRARHKPFMALNALLMLMLSATLLLQ